MKKLLLFLVLLVFVHNLFAQKSNDCSYNQIYCYDCIDAQSGLPTNNCILSSKQMLNPQKQPVLQIQVNSCGDIVKISVYEYDTSTGICIGVKRFDSVGHLFYEILPQKGETSDEYIGLRDTQDPPCGHLSPKVECTVNKCGYVIERKMYYENHPNKIRSKYRYEYK